MMKFFLLFILFFSPFLLSSEINSTESYKRGFLYYKNKEFQKSYEIFSKIYLHHLLDPHFNFSFGRSAYETGHYEMALAAFERVEMQDTSNIRNRLEMARTYFMLKMYEDSENAFKDVLANADLPSSIRKNIEFSLSKVSKVQQKSFTYAQIMMGILYDSNVNYGSIADYEYSGSLLGKIPETSDIALETYATINNIYDIGQKNAFAIKNTLSFYLKEYLDEKDYNTFYLSYSPSLLYKTSKYTTELLLNFDNLSMDRLQYLKSISVVPTLHYKHTPTTQSLVHLKYQVKRFKDTTLDASHYELLYGLQHILSPRSYIEGNIYLIKETKEKTANIYVDFNEYKFNLQYFKHFLQKYTLHLYAQTRYRAYKEYSVGFHSKREDQGVSTALSLSAFITPTLSAKSKLAYEYVDSNQERFTYQKYTAFIGLVKTF